MLVTELRGVRSADLETVNKALVALVTCGGSSRIARNVLTDAGINVQVTTLDAWKVKFSDAYNKLRIEHGDELEGLAILEMRETIVAAGEAERLAIEKAHANLIANRDPDPAKSAQYLSKVKENNVNKMLALSGRPEKVTEQRNVSQILKSLDQLGIRLVQPSGRLEEGTK